MSYDFILFDAGDSGDPIAAAHAWLEAHEQATIAGTPAQDTPPAWHDKLGLALNKRHPELQQATVTSGEPWVEYSQDDGVQLTLYGDSVSLTVPYWHTGEQAERVLLRVSEYLTAVRDTTGFTVYDPQLDTTPELPGDLPCVVERYIRGTQTLRHIASRQLEHATRDPRSSVDESLRDPAAFGRWLAAMDDSIALLLTTLPHEVAGQLDFSPGSLAALERWILERYATVEQIVADAEAPTRERLARYVGETIRVHAGGEWHTSFDDPKSAYYGVPTIRVGRTGAILAPIYLVSASVDRRTGRYLSMVTANQIGHEPPRDPNI